MVAIWNKECGQWLTGLYLVFHMAFSVLLGETKMYFLNKNVCTRIDGVFSDLLVSIGCETHTVLAKSGRMLYSILIHGECG